MMPTYIGLTALSGQIRPDELAVVAGALQTQVIRDFQPEWGVSAIVTACAFNALPAGAIPLIVHDSLDPAANGLHRTRDDERPYIAVPYGPNWSLAASHELLRMLANPTGSARVCGPSHLTGQGTVEYLLDVCGPCQDVAAAYTIDGVAVADFCTKAFFGPAAAAFSFSRSVRQAWQPGANGYVTWLADDGLLYQAHADATGRVRLRGGYSAASRGRMLLHELVDTLTAGRLEALSNAPPTPQMVDAKQNARRARLAQAMRFHEELAWRFSPAPLPTVSQPVQEARRQAARAAAPAALPARDDAELTLRSAS